MKVFLFKPENDLLRDKLAKAMCEAVGEYWSWIKTVAEQGGQNPCMQDEAQSRYAELCVYAEVAIDMILNGRQEDQGAGEDYAPTPPPTPIITKPQVDALGQPLRAGERYVSARGGALVPVTVEGVRWLIDAHSELVDEKRGRLSAQKGGLGS